MLKLSTLIKLKKSTTKQQSSVEIITTAYVTQVFNFYASVR
jgi:hypothetical protein